jgi:hypothetical protein
MNVFWSMRPARVSECREIVHRWTSFSVRNFDVDHDKSKLAEVFRSMKNDWTGDTIDNGIGRFRCHVLQYDAPSCQFGEQASGQK